LQPTTKTETTPPNPSGSNRQPTTPTNQTHTKEHTPMTSELSHPTRTITAKVTCVLVDDDDGYEITVEEPTPEDRYHAKSWRFTVVDASHYPVGSTIELEVPA
jgi:hypothetical protein